MTEALIDPGEPFAAARYAWPDVYCGAVANAVIRHELGVDTRYLSLAAAASSEADMLARAIRAHGSVGAAHDAALMDVPGMRRTHFPHDTRIVWAPEGRLYFGTVGFSQELTDLRGVLLIKTTRHGTWRAWADGCFMPATIMIHYASYRYWGWTTED